jgi:hypothetical protein
MNRMPNNIFRKYIGQTLSILTTVSEEYSGMLKRIEEYNDTTWLVLVNEADKTFFINVKCVAVFAKIQR